MEEMLSERSDLFKRVRGDWELILEVQFQLKASELEGRS